MRLPRTAIALLAALLVIPAAATEVVHFTGGTSMEIAGHFIEEGMIHVDLGGGSTMAFPVSMIDKITESGRPVFRAVDYSAPANVASGGRAGGARRGGGISIASSSSSTGFSRNRNTGRGSGAEAEAAALDKFMDERMGGNDPTFGRGVLYPLANHGSAAFREIGVVGDRRLYGEAALNQSGNTGAYEGTVLTPAGKMVLGGETPSGPKARLGVEVYPMGESNRVKAAKVAASSEGR